MFDLDGSLCDVKPNMNKGVGHCPRWPNKLRLLRVPHGLLQPI